jgi:L-ascorbate metabolism protein UlaG (beta-lactamase superfamily)
VLAIYEVYLYLKSCGVENVEGMNKGGTINVDGIKVTMVDARHSSDIDADGTLIPGGEAAGYVVEFENGTKLYHAGDTSLFMDMKLIGQLYKPDVVILPIESMRMAQPKTHHRDALRNISSPDWYACRAEKISPDQIKEEGGGVRSGEHNRAVTLRS